MRLFAVQGDCGRASREMAREFFPQMTPIFFARADPYPLSHFAVSFLRAMISIVRILSLKAS
jgi:hypothetical protein